MSDRATLYFEGEYLVCSGCNARVKKQDLHWYVYGHNWQCKCSEWRVYKGNAAWGNPYHYKWHKFLDAELLRFSYNEGQIYCPWDSDKEYSGKIEEKELDECH